ncbi:MULTISPECIES: molecular chaperone TorD family protein [Marinobacter]|uniref:Molecular chaperone TorD n=2 Tax=Bacteria TaxID=2 RepID=W5Z0H3_9GAMM|nr:MULTISPECIES: molecular chaperone TorD family protein [Marinobacter]AHI31978.1 molecular chaperone TorD [Marinobacter salarius]MBE96715.1 molecular chaperone TorD [Marinobacter sp.]MBP55982.1 molecular chaperone TorD [Marinobacter sp.]PHQ74225.1 MAG: molecular chaperone TorD [Marinobacter sp.]
MANAAEVQCPRSISDEDRARAQMYRLLGVLLDAPPSSELLRGLVTLEGDDTPIGSASRNLAALAQRTAPNDAEREFNNLFVGIGRGELLPYTSYYLTGFLNEKPLADLRSDLMARGIKARDNVKEPEDHMGTLCEIMAGIIAGEFLCDSDQPSQKAFFDAHLAKWAELFFADLEEAQSAVFYAPVGSLGRAFMAVEADAFAIQ